LFINNIARETSEADLLNAFRQCAVVLRFKWTASSSVSDHLSAQIDMETCNDVSQAISVFDGQVFDGSPIGVRAA
jgi:hypothetical protein